MNLLTIGNVNLTNNVLLAPMAGVTDMAFRILCHREGCGLVATEMVSAKGMLYNSKDDIWRISPEEKPVAVQLFGHEPDVMAEAAKIICHNVSPDVIDINMGCPVAKVVNKSEGCALMRDVPLAFSIMKAVVNAVPQPVTVKIRKGWDDQHVNAVELAIAAEHAGISAVMVHGRTREQFYTGIADWDVIGSVKQSVSIPVIGNGDVRSPQDARRMLEYTSCDGVMIGRAACGDPWIFKRTTHYIRTGELLPLPTAEDRINKAIEHLDMEIALKGEYLAVRQMRKHIAWYIKGLRDASLVRDRLNRLDNSDDVKKLLMDYLEYVEGVR
ncbi:MAG: tRNA-dihydrouridine synthase [Clostridiales bacterium]|nr:tRNA-dihydrouridine synthase [Clostridiales bacterium]